MFTSTNTNKSSFDCASELNIYKNTILLDKNIAIEQSPDSKHQSYTLWLADDVYSLGGYTLSTQSSDLKLYSRHSVKPYWKLKNETNVFSHKNYNDFEPVDKELPLLNGFLPLDLVENFAINNNKDSTANLYKSKKKILINDILSLDKCIVTIVDGYNINISDRKGTFINSLNPITHPFLLSSPNNSSFYKPSFSSQPKNGYLTCLAPIIGLPNLIAVGGINTDQLLYVDTATNEIVGRLDFSGSYKKKRITKIKTPTIITNISDNLLFLLDDNVSIDIVDPIKNLLISSFSINNNTTTDDFIIDYKIKNGSIFILTDKRIIIYQYSTNKVLKEIFFVNANPKDKLNPDTIEMHHSNSSLIYFGNKQKGLAGVFNINDYTWKSNMIRLAADTCATFYNIIPKSEVYKTFDYMGLTPLGDKLIIIHNILQDNQKIEFFDTDAVISNPDQLNLAIQNYNNNKRYLQHTSTESLVESIGDVSEFNLTKLTSIYGTLLDKSPMSLNYMNKQSTSFNTKSSLQYIEHMHNKSTEVSTEEVNSSLFYTLNHKKQFADQSRTVIDPDYQIKVESIDLNNFDEFLKNHTYNEENDPTGNQRHKLSTDFKLLSEIVKGSTSDRFTKHVPCEALLKVIENEVGENSEVLEHLMNGPPLQYRKLELNLEIFIKKNSPDSTKKDASILQSIIKPKKKDTNENILDKFNNTNYCGLLPIFLDNSFVNEDVNLNTVLQMIINNPVLYNMIKEFICKVPWQNKPLLIHEFGYMIDSMQISTYFDTRILLGHLEYFYAREYTNSEPLCEDIYKTYLLLVNILLDEFSTYGSQYGLSNESSIMDLSITTALTGKKKIASKPGNSGNNSISKHQKNIINHLDVYLSKEIQKVKKNIKSMTTEVLTIKNDINNHEFQEIISKNPNWLVSEFEVAISKISPQLYYKVVADDVIPKYCSPSTKFYLTSILFEIDGPQKNQITMNRMSDGWYLFNDHFVSKVPDQEVFDLSTKYPLIMNYTQAEICDKDTNITSSINYDMLQEEDEKFFGEKIDFSSEVAMDSEYVVESYMKKEIVPKGIVKIMKPDIRVLARLTVIKKQQDEMKILFDDYVSHHKNIEDYVTEYSGILPGDLEYGKSEKKLHYRQETFRKFWTLIKRNCRIIGHGLKSDFTGINIKVPESQVIDTAMIYWNGGRLLSLKYLFHKMFGQSIQDNNHDSYEDAYAAFVLYEKYKEMKEKDEEEWDKFTKELFKEAKKSNYKIE